MSCNWEIISRSNDCPCHVCINYGCACCDCGGGKAHCCDSGGGGGPVDAPQ